MSDLFDVCWCIFISTMNNLYCRLVEEDYYAKDYISKSRYNLLEAGLHRVINPSPAKKEYGAVHCTVDPVKELIN